MLLRIFALAACGTNQKQSKEKKETSTVQKSSSDKEHYKGTYSNLNSKLVSKKCTLFVCLFGQESVDKFLGLVTDYDSIVGSVGLTGDFSTFKKTNYNVEKISDLWTKQKGDFVGTNCRINSYTLLKNRIEIPKMKANSELLFVDNDAIDKEKFSMRQTRKLLTFSIHGFRQRRQRMSKSMPRRWKSIFSHFKFNENARMLSVIVHDNLDGNTPFVRPCRRFWFLQRTAISLLKANL